jgi:2-polyprenyl-6-methoxyphenol hydroxylase-like FAD-dependent oxidoreductase
MATKEQTHRSALVWTLPNREAEKLVQADDAEFLAQLQKRFGQRQGKFSFVGKRFSYPLALSTAAEQVRERVVVLGNAAHSLHPVAGQGFNLALRDVAALVAVIEQALLADKAFYSIDVLGQYEKKQQQDQWLTMAFSDVLPQLFASNNVALRLLRGAGLLGLELLPPLKSDFVNFATGFRRSSPLNRGRQSGGLL